MKKKYLILLPLLLLAACQNQPANNTDTQGNTGGGGQSQDDGGGTGGGSSEYIKDAFETPIPALDGIKNLPIGNQIVSAPNNINNPTDISNEVTFTLKDSFPSGNWSYIQGNNKVNTCTDWYDTDIGGFKFRKEYYGFQTEAINSWKYVDIKFHISYVENNTKQITDITKPILHIYGYDKDRNCILQKNIEQGSIDKSKEGTDIELTIKNDSMAYFEVRQNSYPCKGSQCYNFGINQIKVKGRTK